MFETDTTTEGRTGFLVDERAIEGLPVRLVIAFIVGVAALGVMLNMVSGLGGLAVSEVDARPQPAIVGTDPGRVTITAVDAAGSPVAGATVIVRSGTARVDGPLTARTGANGTATFDLDPTLSPNQAEGALEIDVKPPAGSQYVDKRGNTALLVLRDA